ncbi:MAG TPA: ABC transporter substrate-binding protein [Pyrinomonadaceae bacterium]|jgi:branched-chain amino acid transport system substrate-binding protein|nr:ABC transporter substrate-binding protein [Pyrinomonadaceae bacterium]
MKRALPSLGLCLTLLAAAAGCRSGNTDNTPAADDNTGGIRIGVCADASPAGQSTKNGAQLAAEEINKAGGVGGRQVELVFADDGGTNGQGRLRAVVCGPSKGAASAASKAQESKVPLVSTSSADPRFTAAGDYVFRASFLDSFQGEAMAKYAAKNINAKTAAIISESGSQYGTDLANAFEENFTKLGGQVTQKLSYAASGQDFKALLAPLSDSNPEVIYVPGGYAQAGRLAKQARESGIKSTLLGGDGWNDPRLFEAGAEPLDGSYVTGLFSANDPDAAVRKFASDYAARFGGQPDHTAALAYDATKLVADAIGRAGSNDSAKLRDAVAQTANYKGLTGDLSFNAERNAVKPTQIFKIQGGKFYPVFRGDL